MSGFYSPTQEGRRQFLTTAAGALCVNLMPSRWLSAQDDKAVDSVKWALLADTHVAENKEEVYNGSYPFRNLKAIVPGLTAAAPVGAMIVGDVARLDGRPADYRLVKELLEPFAKDAPVFLGLGNHDHRGNFLKVFPGSPEAGKRQEVDQKHVLVVDQAPYVRIVLLDSLHEVNKGAGNLGKAQVVWLEKFLAGSDETPTVFCVHHTLGNGGADILDVGELFRVVEPAKKVKAICYGHSHRFGITERKGIHLINLPPVGYRFDKVTPMGWLEADFSKTGSVLKLVTVDPKEERNGEVVKLPWRS
jgi:Icc protein